MDYEQLATEAIENEKAKDWHTVAASSAKVAARSTGFTATVYRAEEAHGLLRAVMVSHPELSTADMLKVAAIVAERAA